MATIKSTKRSALSKTDKFPLFQHASGQFAKKIGGKLYYFGSDRDAALARYQEEAPNIKAGRNRFGDPQTGGTYRLDVLLEDFLDAKNRMLESGEITKRHFDDLLRSAKLIAKTIGKHRYVDNLVPDDFAPLRSALAKRHNAISLVREIGNCRQPFNWAWKNGKLDRPVKFGTEFAMPTKKKIRLAKNGRGDWTIEPSEIHAMLKASTPAMRAMILLGINAALGPADLASMEFRHVKGEWLTFPRPKTGIDRRCWLWVETRQALDAYLATRKNPRSKEHANRVFVTKYGHSWNGKGTATPISAEFRKTAEQLKLHREGFTFYSLRRTCRTIADEALDAPVCDVIMGHCDDSMAATYRQRIADERFIKVATHVHDWLLPSV